MSSPVDTRTPQIPAPRPSAEHASPRRRPPSQYWDVAECCWRIRTDLPAVP